MKRCLSLVFILLTGCSSAWQDHGNITETVLSPAQQRTVATAMAQAVFSRYGSRSVFSFTHEPTNTFAVQLASALRAKGIGVNEGEHSLVYDTVLHYRVINLNPQQFYTEVDINSVRINQIWSLQGNVLAPVTAQTQGDINGEE